MNKAESISKLDKLLDSAKAIKVENSDDPSFIAWKNSVERFLINTYGEKSTEYAQFKRLRFFYQASIIDLGKDYSSEHLEVFRRDFKVLGKLLIQLREDLQSSPNETKVETEQLQAAKDKVFISHSSLDKDIVEELIEILETIGLRSSQIFCTSFEGYGVDYGENFLERIKTELESNTLVLFVVTANFYASPISLCEMGATWIKANEHIPIVVPPFSFENMKGVIPLTQGFSLNDGLKLSLLKEKIEKDFGIIAVLEQTTWERKRDRILERINKILKKKN